MHLPALPLLPHLRQENLNLLRAPPQHPRPQRQRQPLQPFQQRHKLKRPRLPELRVRRPRPDRFLELPHLHIDEARGADFAGEVVVRLPQRVADLLHPDLAVLAPFADVAVARDGVVVGVDFEVHFLGFEPCAGF